MALAIHLCRLWHSQEQCENAQNVFVVHLPVHDTGVPSNQPSELLVARWMSACKFLESRRSAASLIAHCGTK
jgi:hypothetical protein